LERKFEKFVEFAVEKSTGNHFRKFLKMVCSIIMKMGEGLGMSKI